MNTISPKNLKEILSKHAKWMRGEKGGERANLNGASLDGASLCGASLCGASLDGASLCGASLDNALLDGASLDGASLCDASLRGASLRGASLRGASLDGASLCDASLDGASLCYASLNKASLDGASLVGTSLDGALLDSITLEIINKFYPMVCPEFGAFIGWKKVDGKYIVKLKITETAKRSSALGRKCRCNKARVLAIENKDGTSANITTIESDYDENFKYTVGKIVCVDDFDENRMNECSPGIHFFITRQEAVDY